MLLFFWRFWPFFIQEKELELTYVLQRKKPGLLRKCKRIYLKPLLLEWIREFITVDRCKISLQNQLVFFTKTPIN